MKTHVLFYALAFVAIFSSCKKAEFDVEDPNVRVFVEQLKSEKYNIRLKGEYDEDLELMLPVFSENNIQALINYSKDTTHIKTFPVTRDYNGQLYPKGRDYAILGEYLLWIIEGIRNDLEFGGFDPFMVDTAYCKRAKGLSGAEVLEVWRAYNEWWRENNHKNWKETNPLKNTPYIWFQMLDKEEE